MAKNITFKDGSNHSIPAAHSPRSVAERELAGVSAVLFLASGTVTGVVTRKTVAWTAFINLNIYFLKNCFFMPIKAGTDCRNIRCVWKQSPASLLPRDLGTAVHTFFPDMVKVWVSCLPRSGIRLAAVLEMGSLQPKLYSLLPECTLVAYCPDSVSTGYVTCSQPMKYILESRVKGIKKYVGPVHLGPSGSGGLQGSVTRWKVFGYQNEFMEGR